MLSKETEAYISGKLGEEITERIDSFLRQYNCSFRLTRPRITKRGDFRIRAKELSISVNRDNNLYRFVLTLVHELAHLKTYRDFGKKAKPHGEEWKSNYRQLFAYFNLDAVFLQNSELKLVMEHELAAPRACSGIDIKLERLLAKYDESEEGVFLNDLESGDLFIFRSNTYKKIQKQRTRILCLNIHNGRKYTISKASWVKPITY
jgi:hypothetical protein